MKEEESKITNKESEDEFARVLADAILYMIIATIATMYVSKLNRRPRQSRHKASSQSTKLPQPTE